MWLSENRLWSLTTPMTTKEWASWYLPKRTPRENLFYEFDGEDDEDDEGGDDATGPPITAELPPRLRDLADAKLEDLDRRWSRAKGEA